MDFNAVKKFFFLDDHHKMERFCIIVLLLVAILVSLWGYGLKKKSDLEKLYLTSAAVYTKGAMFSLTKDEVIVHNMYCDKDRTKAFILLQVSKPGNVSGANDSSNPMINLPTDASNYSLWLTAEKGSKVEGHPKAGIYVFGSTGYIGLYFVDKGGFNDAMYNIVFRNDKVIANGVTPATSGSHWETFNDMQIFVNFNGKEAVEAEFLNDEQPDMEFIYTELILKQSMESVIDALQEDLIKMNDRMYRINDYTKRLKDYNIRVPSLPIAIANDFISDKVEDTKDNPVNFDPSMLDDIGYLLQSNNYYNTVLDSSNEENSEKLKSTDLYLSTNYVFPGGLQINYQDISIRNGILDKVKPSDMTYQEWYDSKMKERTSYNSQTNYSISVNDRWMYANGTEFVYNPSNMLLNDKEIYTLIKQYCDEVNSLYTLKRSYQQDKLIDFTRYEYEAKNVSNIFSINTSDNNLVIY